MLSPIDNAQFSLGSPSTDLGERKGEEDDTSRTLMQCLCLHHDTLTHSCIERNRRGFAEQPFDEFANTCDRTYAPDRVEIQSCHDGIRGNIAFRLFADTRIISRKHASEKKYGPVRC